MATSFFTDDKDNPATPAEVTAARWVMAQAYCRMKEKAYDALLNYGVNYREGSAYKNTDLLSQAEKAPLGRSIELYVQWMGRIESDIDAMILRKTFRKV